MAGTQVDLEVVVRRMAALAGQDYGQKLAEIAMRDAALEAAHARIAELEKGDSDAVVEP